MEHSKEWAAYIFAAGAVLAYKFFKYLYDSKKRWKNLVTEPGVTKEPWSARDTAFDWFFEGSATNITSWVTTIGVVWIAGTIYITRMDELLGGFMEKIPLHTSIAFFLGGAMESIAPALAKKIVAKIFPGVTT